MDAIISIATTFIGIIFDVVPLGYLLTAIGAFLVGNWFQRYMLKRNPERLESLVDITNNLPKYTKGWVDTLMGWVAPKKKG